MDLTSWTMAFSEDRTGRRGIWYRKFDLKEEKGSGVEICGGREGDDHYLCILPEAALNQAEVDALIDCLNTQSWMREEKMHTETCERKGDLVVAELLAELSEATKINNDLWDRGRNQQLRINELLHALAEKPELARYAVVTHLREENKHLHNKIEKQAEEIATLKRALTKKGEQQ